MRGAANSTTGQSMSHLVMSKQARVSLTVAAMSALVVWHSLAMMIASAPYSAITVAARSVFYPYLTLFRLDNNWGFFAPNVPRGFQFRYDVEDAAGVRHSFIPDRHLSRIPSGLHLDSRSLQDGHGVPDVYGDATAAELCREHASLHPITITLLSIDQNEFWPSDWLNGKHPLDDDFVTVTTQKTVRCPDK